MILSPRLRLHIAGETEVLEPWAILHPGGANQAR